MPTITLAHSPDADDLVMWWPLTGMTNPDGSPLPGEMGRPAIDTKGFDFRTLAADIQTLNQRAEERGDLDVTAISAYSYPFVADRYRITSCGGSFGDGYGPKVVVRQDSTVMCDGCLRAKKPSFAVPGERTTAFLVLSILLDQPFEYEVVPFQDVGPAVAEGRAGAGLLIHEAQLTYRSLDLREVIDLGAWWKTRTGMPLPLGLNVVSRGLDAAHGAGTVETIASLLAESVRYSRAHPAECRRFLRDRVGDRPEWADDELIERYLGMYVNDLTADMGDVGRRSLARLYADAAECGMAPEVGAVDPIGA